MTDRKWNTSMFGFKPHLYNGAKQLLFLWVVFCGALMISSCGVSSDGGEGQDKIIDKVKGYDTALEGKVTVIRHGEALANSEHSVILEFEPGKLAILYTSENTQLVGHDRLVGLIPWRSESTYLIKGNKTTPRNAKKVGDDLLITSPVGTELWVDVGYVELLSDTGKKSE